MQSRVNTNPQVDSDKCEIDFVDQARIDLVRKAMKPERTMLALAEMFKVLGDPTRIKLVIALSTAELCVCDMANLLGVSQSAVSHSLRVLRQMKLVKYRKDGKIVYYSLDDHHISHLIEDGMRHVEEPRPIAYYNEQVDITG
jgi:DNA-binding transcriptional ArsR family regulator